MRQKCFRGTILRENRSTLLRVCSRSLYKALKDKTASVKIYRKGLIVIQKTSNGNKFMKSSKGDVVELAITKFVGVIQDRMNVNVYFSGFNLKNVTQHDVALKSPVYTSRDVPKPVYWVRAFLRNNRRGIKITLHRKAVADLAKKYSTRVLFQPTNKGIILRKSKSIVHGRKLYSLSKSNNAHVTEIAFPKDLRNKFNGQIGIPINEFDIKPNNFSMTELEGRLLMELTKKGLDVRPGTTRTIGDIILPNGGYVEVTNSNPNSGRGSRHTSTAMLIRGKIFEAEHLSFHKKIKPIFIVINKTWIQNKHIEIESVEAKELNVYTMFTDFKHDWEKPIAYKILSIYRDFST